MIDVDQADEPKYGGETTFTRLEQALLEMIDARRAGSACRA